VGILQLDAKGDCAFSNRHAAYLAGVTPEQARGQGWIAHLDPGDRSSLKTRLAKASRGAEGLSLELHFTYPGGGMAHAQLILIPLAESAEKVIAYLAVLTDITARKNLEQQLAQAQKMEAIGRLAGGVAHDFNNMLTAISTYATQLLDLIPESSPARGVATEINKMTDHTATVTRQLLAFSRKQLLHPERVDLNRVIRDMFELLTQLLGEGIEVKLTLDPDAGLVSVDRGQIQQVILNLVINARDAMDRRGMLTLTTGKITLDQSNADREQLRPGSYVMLAVTDSGSGMDHATREQIFEPFFTTKPAGEGTGLGLSMVYGIVTQSGGTIRVESARKKGSTFRIYLPGTPPDGNSGEAVVPASRSRGTETVLVVEDAAVVRSLVRELLEEHGYHVLEASDAKEALAVSDSQKDPIDLLLTDLVMPGMSGNDLAKLLRRKRKKMKILYMSGYSGESLQEAGKAAHFLEKPFKPDVLADTVRKVLDGK